MSYYFMAGISIRDAVEYQEILKFRLRASRSRTILIKGKD